MEEVDGVKKAAILLISLGQEISAQILKHLPESMIQQVSYEIANINQVQPEERVQVMSEFLGLSQAREYILEGGFEYAKEILNKALEPQRAKEVIDMLNQVQLHERPFNIARKADPQQLLNVLLNEQSQTVALVLCYMQPDKAALVLSGFPLDKQAEIAERIGTISQTSPVIIEKIEKVIENKFSSFIDSESESVGGVHTLVDILNSVGRGTEKSIIQELEKKQPRLADDVKAELFIFEEIVQLAKADVQKVLQNVDNDDLTMALKGVSDEIKEFIYSNLSQRAVETMKENMQYLGPARLSVVEEAQEKVVAVIRQLDDQGEIYIRRGEQDEIVS